MRVASPAPLLFSTFAVVANAFTSSTPTAFTSSFSHSKSHSQSSSLHATTTDAISKLDASQKTSVDRIAASIPDLQPKPSLSWSTETISGQSPSTLDARDAPGPANIAWLAAACVPNKLSSLSIFVGPLTDVPHLLSRCTVDEGSGSMTLTLDCRPRAYGAYELPEAERGPDKLGRDSFTYKANRAEYESQYMTEEFQSIISSSIASLENAQMLPVDGSEYESLTRGPFMTKVRMSLTDRNVDIVAALREEVASRWLVWATEGGHDHRPGAPVNSQYVYDSKYRQNAYLAMLQDYNEVFGADGPKMSAAESGPLDEAYVGGGS
mmetsp:Transcript_75/g.104  ORF Transcript_75/g.104 Transcript_75/m.104 type:complete len:323 (-) Transcript_75:50-1018(-)|eukprot:CAMPEP_0203685136 /NCGR_PEP_ID=MMETSP0090-20130426/48391_1 /ASSEMBLY_ACC=CAM_ASM_001088 /TAXON_ID=426623 /ORGANISM="Chaetoceros affinis, Strain CCMP159" /LENGTH=322 /DNA_ID=CAMNT_0050554321 /DNA_START=168 /DNA_END=1136 /DNA_ORIENTATION=-